MGNQQINTQNRNAGINILRGFLILGVVLNHLWGDVRYLDVESHIFYVRFAERAGDGEWSRLPTSLLDMALSGGFIIPSFMMLSGVSLYLSVSRYRTVVDLGAWLHKRFRLLLVPYWYGLGLTAATIVGIALAQMALHGESLAYQLKHVTEARYDYAYQGWGATLAAITIVPRMLKPEWLLATPQMLWFVVLLLQYYLLFPVLVRVMNRMGPLPFLALAFASTVAAKLVLAATIGLDSHWGAHINHVFTPFRWHEFALGMVIGYVLAHHREAMASRLAPGRVSAALVAGGLSLVVAGIFIDDRGSLVGAVAAPLVITAMSCAYLPLLAKAPGRLEATWPMLLFAMCGPLSYAVLVANEPLRLVGSFLRVEDVPTAVWWSFLIAYVPVTIVFARWLAPVLGIGPRAAVAVPVAATAVAQPEAAAAS
jgi:peptidoglycan/LPS O-acetylase OafA/YrhL